MKPFIDPNTLASPLKRLVKIPRSLTARQRVFPDFIIIGAQRCGTTSLYRYLIQHPRIAPAFRKELHFFSKNFKKGPNWYREHFPTHLYCNVSRMLLGKHLITGEASADYVFHPHAPRRTFDIIPQVKLIVILRNPVDRAYSHYYHEVRQGRERLSFEAAIRLESERLEAEQAKVTAEDLYSSYNYRRYSYLARGLYAEQLKAWMAFFPRKQFLVIRSEDFNAEPSKTIAQTLEYLGLEKCELDTHKRYNYAGYPRLDASKYNYPAYPRMSASTRKTLTDYFKPYNQRLYELLERDFLWDG